VDRLDASHIAVFHLLSQPFPGATIYRKLINENFGPRDFEISGRVLKSSPRILPFPGGHLITFFPTSFCVRHVAPRSRAQIQSFCLQELPLSCPLHGSPDSVETRDFLSISLSNFRTEFWRKLRPGSSCSVWPLFLSRKESSLWRFLLPFFGAAHALLRAIEA